MAASEEDTTGVVLALEPAPVEDRDRAEDTENRSKTKNMRKSERRG